MLQRNQTHSTMPSDSSRPTTVPLDIDLNRSLLNRYRYVLQEGMRFLAGWLPAAGRFELKCEMARSIWESSLHVNAFYLRLREIQSPAFQKPNDSAFVSLVTELPHAPDEFALALAYYRVLLPDLILALETHETATFPNSDQPSVHAIKHALVDLHGQLQRLNPLLDRFEQEGRITAAAREWVAYIKQLLRAAGGTSGRRDRGVPAAVAPKGRVEFQAPKEANRDERFTNRGADEAETPAEDDYAPHTVEEFERYSTEMLAAETVAVVLYSLPDAPWEFQFDSARHLYDEVRHCLMGYEWMRRHGYEPFRSPQYLPIFKWRAQFDPVMQYCMLTMGNEVHAFPYRHRRVEAHQKAGDSLSEQFVRYDIADETQHVRFGNRWLPKLLQLVGETRSFEAYTKDALEVWSSQYLTGKLPVTVE